MLTEEIALILLALPLVLGTFLPSFGGKHWFVRTFDFIRIQSLVLMSIIFVLSFFLLSSESRIVMAMQLALFISIGFQLRIISPYILIGKRKKPEFTNSVSIISVNVLQTNTEYQRLIDTVKKHRPEILLTIETDKAWEEALTEIESDYSFSEKVAKENTYGMHFYTKLKVNKVKVHYLMSDERPSIEAHLEDTNQNEFVFWGVHPPPPSPTEETTSKKKDGELMSIAKIISKSDKPNLVIGDFNSVCWSAVSKLFARTSDLIDARERRGFFSTFPVRPFFLRFPIDLLYHSKAITIGNMTTLEDIGSDHLPLFSEFNIESKKKEIAKPVEKDKVEEIIEEGKEAESTGD